MSTAAVSLAEEVGRLRLARGVSQRAEFGVRGLPAAASGLKDAFKAIVALLAHRESQGHTWLGFDADGAIDIDPEEGDEDPDGDEAAEPPSGAAFDAHLREWHVVLDILKICQHSPSAYMTTLADLTPRTEFAVDVRRKRLMFGRSAANLLRFQGAIDSRITAAHAALSDADRDALAALFPAAPADAPSAKSREEQVAAAERIVTGSLTVMTGPPGTGKTYTIVRAALAWLTREVERAESAGVEPRAIQLMAPTGRAAARMGELIQTAVKKVEADPACVAALGRSGSRALEILKTVKPTTIHAGLESTAKPEQPFRRHADNPLEAGLVIVDEASMLGVELARRLVEATSPDTHLCLVGDPGQLPAVEIGSVLVDLVGRSVAEGPACPWHRRLTVSRRFPPGSPIDILACAIHGYADEKTPDLMASLEKCRVSMADIEREHAARIAGQLVPRPETTSVRWLESSDRDAPKIAKRLVAMQMEEMQFRAAALRHRSQHTDPAAIDAALRESMVLCARRRGPVGSAALSAETLKGPGERLRRVADLDGAAVMITRNDRALSLTNGDLGIVIQEGERDEQRPMARFGNGRHYDARCLPPHVVAPAVTVHKGQGSEWERVAVIAGATAADRNLRCLLYTALTRATNVVTLVCSREVLQACGMGSASPSA